MNENVAVSVLLKAEQWYRYYCRHRPRIVRNGAVIGPGKVGLAMTERSRTPRSPAPDLVEAGAALAGGSPRCILFTHGTERTT